jgi:D-arginine dehydrogenase
MRADALVIGAGIAGASTGYFLSRRLRVVVLERERQPGYHTTGRSAALFAESYGTDQVRALTLASRPFFEAPPAGFCEHPILAPRGALFVGDAAQAGMLDALFEAIAARSTGVRRLDGTLARALVPVLRPEAAAGAVLDPGAADMDVHGLHQGFLRGIRDAGGAVVCNAEVDRIERRGGTWCVGVGTDRYEAPVLIDAAGAWCDVVAALAGVAPLGLVARRRTAFTFAPPPDTSIAGWPAVIGVDESYYFKPEAGMLLGSPANADPVAPQDVQPETQDVATGIWRIEQATTLRIPRPASAWAGLRSFVDDGDLVGGFDPDADGFFWCAAQGGYGIQTSAAMGQACAALVCGEPLPPHIVASGVTRAGLSPARLRKAAA